MLALVHHVRSWDQARLAFAGSILRRNAAVKLTTLKDGVVRRCAEISCLAENILAPSCVIQDSAGAVSYLCRLRAIAERSTKRFHASNVTILLNPTTTNTYLSIHLIQRMSPRRGLKALFNAAQSVVANSTVATMLAKSHVILRMKRQHTVLYHRMWLLIAHAARLAWMKSWPDSAKHVRTRSHTVIKSAARRFLVVIIVMIPAILEHADHAFRRLKFHVGVREHRSRHVAIRALSRSQNAFEHAVHN